jgi:thiol:disulfide interchange protein DsbC
MVNLKRIVSGIVLITFANCVIAGETEIRKSLTENLPETKIGEITKLPYSGLYQVIVNGTNIIYTDENGKVGIFGTMLDLKNKIDLTQLEKDKVMAQEFPKLPFDKAIVRIKGNGTGKLALFADPECPYCKGFENELEHVNNVTIYTFLLPLSDIHPGALRKSQLIWCSKDRAKAWEDMLLHEKEPEGSNTKCDNPIKEIADFAAKQSITGTPSILFNSGKMLFGNQPYEMITKLLDESKQTP